MQHVEGMGTLDVLAHCLLTLCSGSVLVVDGEVVAEAQNTAVTEVDPTGHVSDDLHLHTSRAQGHSLTEKILSSG